MNSPAKKQCLIVAIIAFFFSLFYACQGEGPSITGTYINHAESEFSIADDTIMVESKGQNNYVIHRKTGFRLIGENGELGKLQLETEEWKTVFDEGSETMTERSKGRVISFDPAKGLLMLENSKYQRIDK